MNFDNRIRKNFIVFCLLLGVSIPSYAEVDWVSVTLDNDLFVGNDNGYTNGLYVSFFDVGDASSQLPDYDFWVTPLMWSMPKNGTLGAVNSYMIGQTMSTPSDINIVVPDENELPYAALLSLTNSYVAVTPTYADRVSTTIGIVGPAALGEEAQKFVHDIIGADEPQGWDTQLKNELVFQFSRGRIWRTWASDSGHFDFLTSADLGLGTIQSYLSTGMTIRYGRDLVKSYATNLLNNSRTTNPSAVNGGWYIYGGIQAGYAFNQIFTDGNTFRDSRSIDYEHEYIGVTAGIAYSWQNFSLTFAVNDSNVIQSGDGEETLENLTQYGTITVAWRM
ncbi:lipid A deacylase LpxR family protein [Neptunomonas phycophila]|uniref:lipid A deacylase LpxR family protein n=1 Tax=Neptunomonas phycophila TaxID=1572645 RepID=UPI0015B84679|nr:lipid A deacylase LpxR family protein [Neptunomonas phycophila]QLE98172.1 lipid A deacylase LpxR family protein [Neptunomonas phycophila]